MATKLRAVDNGLAVIAPGIATALQTRLDFAIGTSTTLSRHSGDSFTRNDCDR